LNPAGSTASNSIIGNHLRHYDSSYLFISDIEKQEKCSSWSSLLVRDCFVAFSLGGGKGDDPLGAD
jgi:hypothetical protein